MTTGGYDPNDNPEGGKPADPYGQGDPYSQQGPPPGNYPPPGPPPGNYPPPGPPPGNYPPPGPPPGGSYPPPPPGNYPPPPGNYPPPPPSYGAPGYGAPGYGAPGPTQLSVGDAITYGWNKFKDNAAVWIGILLVAAIISIVINLLFGGWNSSDEFSVLRAIGVVVSTIVGYLIQAALIRGALHEVDGNKPAFGSFFQFANVGAIIIASLIVGVATGIGFILLVIPGLVVMFLTWFTLQFVIDQNQDAITAIKSSFGVISQNVGPLLLLALANVGILIVGALLCGVGLLVAFPITIIASTYAYRVLTGRFVSA